MASIGMLLAAASAAAQTTLPEKGSLQPAAAVYSVAAGAGEVTILLQRTVGASGAVGCAYTTADGTAVAGTDYTMVAGTLSWADGDSSDRPVVVPLLASATGGKSFSLRLSAPTGGAFLGVAPTSPPTNHEGRVLGATPQVTNVLWNTPEADAIMATLQIMPANSPWNEDISQRPLLSNSTTMVNGLGAGTHLHLNRDMNFVIVPAGQARKAVSLLLYADESDPGPYPVPDNAPIEGYLGDDPRSLPDIQQDINPAIGGDRHSSVLDPVNGYLYEFGRMVRDSNFVWRAAGEATFNIRSNQLRPDTWTSADAAGLPIMPSIPRFDECERGMVEHALRFTVVTTRNTYVYPATHRASSATGADLPRMGERFRLRNSPSVNATINGMSKHPKAIALALQKYGMFVADNGSSWFVSAGSDPRLQNLSELTALAGGDFEVVEPTGPNEGPRQYSTATVNLLGDGGVAPDDGGAWAEDGGAAADGGAPADGGAMADAGMASPDGGSMTDAGVLRPDAGASPASPSKGCGCAASTSGGGGAVWLLAALAGLFISRRAARPGRRPGRSRR
jgi:hypothetical protein